MTLDEIFIKNGTDKSSLSHNYASAYEKHLPSKVNKFLEIGCYKGAMIRSFKEWYGEGKFYALDRFLEGHGLITIEQLQSEGINAFHGDQKDMWFLEQIKDVFEVIIDDGSHHWADQITTFTLMFKNNVASGGWYVIEDIFDDVYWGQGLIKEAKDNIRGKLKRNEILPELIGEAHYYDEVIFVKRK